MTNTINEMEKLIEEIEDLDWAIEKSEDHEYQLSKYSPAGQDFSFMAYSEEGNPSFILDTIYKAYENFDVSEETYLWLDESGHGANGAPYDMRDLYDDMEACQEMILDLYNELTK